MGSTPTRLLEQSYRLVTMSCYRSNPEDFTRVGQARQGEPRSRRHPPPAPTRKAPKRCEKHRKVLVSQVMEGVSRRIERRECRPLLSYPLLRRRHSRR